MTEAEIIDGVIAREIRGDVEFTDDPDDSGGPTKFGITAGVLGEWRHLGRKATRHEVQAMTVQEARAIYVVRYVSPFAGVDDDGLRVQLIDFGVLSGPMAATQALQRAVMVEDDGVLGPVTWAAIAALPPWVVRRLLVGARCKVLSDLAQARPKDRKYIRGWVARAVSFW